MNIWEQKRVPPNFWSSIENQRSYLNWLARKHNVKQLEDWYKVPSRAFPIRFLKIYGNYHSQILSAHFPNYEWIEWKFVRTPHNFWASMENRRRYMDWLGQTLGFSKTEDWYSVTGDDFKKNYGEGLLSRYYQNVYQFAVMDIYNGFEWCEWLYKTTPDGFWGKGENQRRYLTWLGKKLGYQSLQDWYRLTYELLIQNNGYGIYHRLGSVSAVVKNRFPYEEVNEWQFQACSNSFWKSKNNRLCYLNWLGTRLGYKKTNDWYKVTSEDFHKNFGGGLLQAYYGNSPSRAIKDIYSDFQWCEWLFVSAPQSFWSKKENCRRYMDWLGYKLRFTKLDDWYKINVSDFQRNSGIGFLSHFRSSPTKAVIDNYPEYSWDVSKFFNRPQSFWKSEINRKIFLDYLFVQLKFQKLDDWYKSSHEDFTSFGGSSLLKYYGGSHVRAIMENYTEHNWLEWKFNFAPQKFWNSPANRKKYMIWLGKQLGYSEMNDWYRITGKEFLSNYGGGMLSVCFGGSPSRAVSEIFSEYKWLAWMFRVAPQRFWKKKDNRKQYIIWLENRLGITHPEEWYEITKKRFADNYGSGFLDYYNNSVVLAVFDCFPDYNLEIENFSQKRANQKRIFKIFKEIWVDTKWQYKHPDLRFKDSGAKMELDIWIPNLKLAIEYQGEQHFFPVKQWGGDVAFKKLLKRDQEKRDMCKEKGIKLIEIPYTWDGDKKSVLGLIDGFLTFPS